MTRNGTGGLGLLIRPVVLIGVSSLAVVGVPGAGASAAPGASHHPNVFIYGPRAYTELGSPKCAEQLADGHGTVERVSHHGQMYLRLSLNSDESVVQGTASYWSVHPGPHALNYSRPWRGQADLPYRRTVSIQGVTQRVLLGQVIVQVYDPTVHVTSCKKAPTTTRDGPTPASPGRISEIVPTPSASAISLQWTDPANAADAGTYVLRTGGPSGAAAQSLPDHQIDLPAGSTRLTDDDVTAGYTYIYTLYAHRADGVIGPAEKVAVAALPPGEYTVKVTIDPALVKKAGGWSKVRTKIAQQFAVLNGTFNDPVNHLQLHYDFHVNQLTRFSGSCRAAVAQPHPESTFLLAEVDKCSKAVFGESTYAAYFPSHLAIVDAHRVGTIKLKAFAADEGETLAHEFGHSRGAIDEYNVIALKGRNPITHTGYDPPASIMNDQFLTHVFDPYTQHVINSQGNALTLDESEAVAARLLPTDVQVQVLLDGQPLTTPATVRLWPVGWGEKAVETEPTITKVTDAQGLADMGHNVFGRTELSPPWDITTPLLLATVVHNGEVASGWVSIIDATNATFGQADQTYVVTLNLTSQS